MAAYVQISFSATPTIASNNYISVLNGTGTITVSESANAMLSNFSGAFGYLLISSTQITFANTNGSVFSGTLQFSIIPIGTPAVEFVGFGTGVTIAWTQNGSLGPSQTMQEGTQYNLDNYG
jgi:hypothetical protein